MKILQDVQLGDKSVVYRTDYNVSIDVNGKIIDDYRIEKTLPTIKYLLKKGVKKVNIISHLGRPIIREGESLKNIIDGNKSLSMRSVAKELSNLLGLNCDLEKKKDNFFILEYFELGDRIRLYENIRFDAREEKNDQIFAKEISSLGDVFVNDAFGNAHRKHASMVAVTKYIPSYAGLLMQSEVEKLGGLIKDPQKPFVLILGGAKVDEKIMTLKNVIEKADKVLLGGVMANTFLASRNVDLKLSKVEKDSVKLAGEIYSKYAKKIYLPTDLVWDKNMAVDIGQNTIEEYEKVIEQANTIFWNGTMGLTSLGKFNFDKGTVEVARAVAESSAKNKIVCGGDTTAQIEKNDLSSKFSHVSTGGGASLKFLAGEKLSALEALENN